MKKLLSIALLIILTFVLAVPAIAVPAKDNPNQDFTDLTITDYDIPEELIAGFIEGIIPIVVVPVGYDLEIPITFTNNADRGLPQLSIWVNFEQVAYWGSVSKGQSVTYVLKINTEEAGEALYYLEIWTRKGNKNFEDKGEGAAYIVVVDVPAE